MITDEMVALGFTQFDPPGEPNPLGDEEGDSTPPDRPYQTPLLQDIAQVLDMALGKTAGARSIVADLRRVRARIEQAMPTSGRSYQCFVETCIQHPIHLAGDIPLCCTHYSEQIGDDCGCNDDYLDALSEQAMGSYRA